MKRRSFLKTVAVGLGAFLVNPKLLLAKPKLATPARKLGHSSVAITPVLLSWMQKTYFELSFGNQHPTLIRVSPHRFDEIWMKIEPLSRYFSERRLPYPSIRFLNADIMALPEVDDCHFHFINEKMPHDPRLNRCAVVGECIWFDAKGKERREMMNA